MNGYEQLDIDRLELALAEARRLNAELVEALGQLIEHVERFNGWSQRNDGLEPARAVLAKAKQL